MERIGRRAVHSGARSASDIPARGGPQSERKASTMNAMRFLRAALAVGAVGMLMAGSSIARADGITNEQAQDILNELKAIRQVLEKMQSGGQQAPAPDDKVSYKLSPGGFSMGDAKAPLVMVEYTDFQCPFCQQFHNTAFAQIKANYIDTGKVRFVSRDFPLDFHDNARRAATAGRCAAEQGKYWEMRHMMIVNADQLQADKLMSYAANVKLDVPKFKSCLDAPDKFKAQIDQDIAEGGVAGVQGTPSFVLGYLENDKLQGVRLVGAQPYSQFDAKIQEMLDQAGKK
ncbi:MAG TPA: DsbA family protein [Casimicrobiaceae bacterium]|nr:DsbA family protein [Casimicrobiaceae bacterium]